MITAEELNIVVLMEDWDIMRYFMEECLKRKKANFTIRVCNTLDETEKMLDSNKVSLLILKITEKNDDKILKLTQKVKNTYPGIGVVLTTLTKSAVLVEKARKAGADSIWQEDISESSFLRAVERFL